MRSSYQQEKTKGQQDKMTESKVDKKLKMNSSHGNNATGKGSKSKGGCDTKTPTTKFTGNCPDLQGHLYDCSSYKQADQYTSTTKHIAKYMGAEYKRGGDIRSTIEKETKCTIPLPTKPATNANALVTKIFNKQVDSYVERMEQLNENIQKAYSLVLGQWTKLMKSKIKQSNDWKTVSTKFNVIDLLAIIKAIIFNSKDQNYKTMSIHQAKSNFYYLRQGNSSNPQYLKRFNNVVDMAETHKDKLHGQATLNTVSEALFPNIGYTNLDALQKGTVDKKAMQTTISSHGIH